VTARTVSIAILLLLAIAIVAFDFFDSSESIPEDREEVIFWHFWGGEDREVVDGIVRRFNDSQEEFFVRTVAMPGNNLDVKLFLSVTGGNPPDLINQDDPIVADWAHRGALLPLDELATPQEVEEARQWLFPAARKLTEYGGRMYGLCNALDIRALYYNMTLFDEYNLKPPQSPDDLMQIAEQLSLVDIDGRRQRFGYLPDSRRLWAWGVVFGGDFLDSTNRVTASDAEIIEALAWMQSFSHRFGPDEVAAFRQGDQSLPGKIFPLLPVSETSPHGRYAVIMDGQWRVRDIARSQQARREAGLAVAKYGVCALPAPPDGRPRAGWVNGNFFLVPRGAKNRRGAWAFMKFWTGLGGHEVDATKTCVAGGWIPVSQNVVDQREFQEYLKSEPLFCEFVELAASSNQIPIPVIPGAPYFNREIKNVGGNAMIDLDASPAELLNAASRRIQEQIDRVGK